MKIKKYEFYIGIDTGVNTGFATWSRDSESFVNIETLLIHQAMQRLTNLCANDDSYKEKMFVRVEDARLRKWFGKTKEEVLQGAGSIKRDAKIWEDFLKELGVDFEMVAPRDNKTKMDADLFKKITRWNGKTNEHSRDAAMLVYKM